MNPHNICNFTVTLATITIVANFSLSADTRLSLLRYYIPQCGGGQITVVNPTGKDSCREAKDTSVAPHCLIALANNQSPSKGKGWKILKTRTNDICKVKLQKKTPNLYVRPEPVCDGSYTLKVDSKGLEDRCIKKTKKYRIKCQKGEVHLTKGPDKYLINDTGS